jgi:hypothetical protein
MSPELICQTINKFQININQADNQIEVIEEKLGHKYQNYYIDGLLQHKVLLYQNLKYAYYNNLISYIKFNLTT